MNKIYKVIWSKVKNCYVVASELAKNHTKSPKSSVVSGKVENGIMLSLHNSAVCVPTFSIGFVAPVATSMANFVVAKENKPFKITVAAIVKNEAENVPIWVQAARSCADEIVVVDTGSTDGTVERFADYGIKCFHYDWNDDFASAKNYMISLCHGDWIVLLDGDEWFREGCDVRKAIAKHHNNPITKAIIADWICLDKDGNNAVMFSGGAVRAFRNQPDVRYFRKVHENLTINYENFAFEPEFKMYHTGYSGSVNRSKHERNLRIMRTMFDFDNGKVEYPTDWRYIEDTYAGLGQFDKALWAADKMISFGVQEYSAAAWITKFNVLFAMKTPLVEMRRQFEYCFQTVPSVNGFRFLASIYYFRNGLVAEGLDNYIEGLRMLMGPQDKVAMEHTYWRMYMPEASALASAVYLQNKQVEASLYACKVCEQYCGQTDWTNRALADVRQVMNTEEISVNIVDRLLPVLNFSKKAVLATALVSSLTVGMVNPVFASCCNLNSVGSNQTTGNDSTVTGGYSNQASGCYSSVSGGAYNTASGADSSVTGGQYNTASGCYSSVSGGRENIASGCCASVTGGQYNIAGKYYSYVDFLGRVVYFAPGASNVDGNSYTISGNQITVTEYDGNHVYTLTTYDGSTSSVSGGKDNVAAGTDSSVSGGSFNVAVGDASFVAGGCYNIASGKSSSIIGGRMNTATGDRASVFGGCDNIASCTVSSVFGGCANKANGESSSVVGGRSNTASGTATLVVGGCANIASGQQSVAVGGINTYAYACYSTAIGGGITGSSTCSYTAQCSVAIGKNATTTKNYEVAIGSSTAPVTIGGNLTVTGTNTVTDGTNTKTWSQLLNASGGSGGGSTPYIGICSATGFNNESGDGAVGTDSIAIGACAKANCANSIAIGKCSKTNGEKSVAVGSCSSVAGCSVAVGYCSYAANCSIAVGYNTFSNYANSVAVGYNNSNAACNSVAIGASIQNFYGNSVILGTSITNYGSNSIVIGTNASNYNNQSNPAKQNDSVIIGVDSSNWFSMRSTLIGYDSTIGSSSCSTGGCYNSLIGACSSMTGGYNVGVGSCLSVTGSCNVAIGQCSGATGSFFSTALGAQAFATCSSAAAIGSGAYASAESSVALGNSSAATVCNVISVGHKATDLTKSGTAYGNTFNRRIINVADGIDDTDVVTVGQLNTAIANAGGGGATAVCFADGVVLAGCTNTASGCYSSVTGGRKNTASGCWSSVSGGGCNTASCEYSSVSGGSENIASGEGSAVSGGCCNTASGWDSSVSGGGWNEASGTLSSVSGGYGSTASGLLSSVNGGWCNRASGNYSSIIGGCNGFAYASYSTVIGGGVTGVSTCSDIALGSVAIGKGSKTTKNYEVAIGSSFAPVTIGGNLTVAGINTVTDGTNTKTWTDIIKGYILPAATSSALGGVKIGSNITNTDGTISLTKANVTAALGYTPPTADTDTHYTTHLYAGSGTAANAATTNGNTKITIADNSTVNNLVTIKGTGATTVTSDANGVITVNSTDNNTTYSAGTGLSLSGTTFSVNTNGSIASGNTGVLNGGTVYSEVRPTADGTFAKKANTTAANITALDTAAKNAIKGLSVSGTTITYTKGDGTTGTITTQDNNITYSAFTGATASAAGTAGLVKAPAAGDQNKFLRGDGTWAVDNDTKYTAMSADEATTGTATTARSITAKVLSDYVTGKVSAETTARTTAINSEATTRANADTALGTRIDNAISAYESADTGLSNRIGTLSADGNYIKKSATNNVSANLTALDTQLKTTTTAVSTETTNRTNADTALSNRIGSVASDGTFIKKSATNNVATNLTALDTAAKNAIKGLSVSGTTITYTKGDGTTGTITTQDNNTTYDNMSASELSTGTATTARSISAKVLSDYVTGKVSAEATARTNAINSEATTRANADTALGTRIDGTIKDLSVSGTTITYIKSDGTTGTITTQDTNTTYGTGTADNLTTGTDTTGKIWTSKVLADYVKGQVATETTNRTTAVSNEATARNEADTALSNRIGSLTADGNYIKKSATNNVSANLTALDTQLKTTTTAVSTETTNRTNADTTLGNRIGTVSADGNYIKASTSKNIAENIGLLDTAVKANATSIANEVTNRTTAVTNEATARSNADTALGTRIDNAVSAYESADTGLSNRIGTLTLDGNYIKKSDTKNVSENLSLLDTQLKATTTAVSTEATTRANADTALGTRIDGTIKGLSVSGRTITYTKGDGTTGTITTQDTTYSAGSGLSLSNGIFSVNTNGAVVSGNTGIVTGGTVYDALEARLGQSNVTAGTQDAVTVGGNTTVTGDGAVAVGTGSTVNGESSVAVGDTSTATGDNSVALGGNTTAEGDNTIAVGGNSTASDEGAVAVGGNTEASAQNAVAVGTGSSASTADSTAVGGGSSATGNHSTALGGNTIVNNNNSVALGYDSNASQDNVLSVGHKATDLDVNGNAYGTDLTRRIVNVANGTTATDVATVGQTYTLQNSINTTVADVGTNAIGQHIYQMTVNTDGQVASGNTGIVTGGTVYEALESRIGQITVGNDAQNTVALGDNSSVSGDGAVAVGSGSSGSGEGSVAIGDTSSSSGEGSVAVGTNTTAQSDNTVAIGTGSTIIGTNSNNSVAIGQQTSVTGSNSVALGGGSSVTGSDSVALGGGSSVTGSAATAVGKNTVVTNDNSVAIGSGSNASQDNVVSVGHSATDLDSSGTAYGSDLNRRIVNVADAVNAHDAVTKGQMDALMADHVGTLATNGNYILKDNTTSANMTLLDTQLKSAVDSIGTLSNNAVAYSSTTKDAVVYSGTNGTVLRNVKGGAVTQTSMEAVNGSQLYAVKQDITGFASDIQANATNIDNLNSSVTAALSSVSASGLLVDSLDSSKADKSLSNLSDAGKRVLKSYAEDAVATYLAEQGLAVPAAPMAINTTNSNTLAVTNAGNGSLHVGEGSYVNGTSSIAIGVGNQVNANNSGAFGDPSIINADESYVLGNDDTINTGATGSFIVGNDGVSDAKGGLLFGSNTKATVEAEDAIGLGNRTEVSAKGAIALGSDSIADTENTLSIGNSNLKRKIVNVADGDISQNSSEAVTGAQLFVMNEKVQKNTEALEKKADVDAGNINVSDWATKLGVGKVENGNADLVTGGTVYDAIQGIKGNDLVQTNGDVITIGANNAASVIDVSDSMGQGRKITGVITDVNDATSAANVGYVNAITDNIVKSTNSAIQRVDNKVNKVGANAAAIANLPTPPFDGEEKWAFAAGVGHYQGETAGAVGAFYRPTDNVIARVSGSFGNGDEMVGAGVAVSLNKGNTPAVSKAQMVRTINAQAERIQSLESNRSADREQIERQNAVIANMQEAMVRMQEELAELKAK